jgi:hypothetical protein
MIEIPPKLVDIGFRGIGFQDPLHIIEIAPVRFQSPRRGASLYGEHLQE